MPSFKLNNLSYFFEMRIFRDFRKKYQLEDALFASNGNLLYTNVAVVRRFAYAVNKHRKPAEHIYPGELFTTGMLHEASHGLLESYQREVRPNVFGDASTYLAKSLGKQAFYNLMEDFTQIFPPASVYSGKETPKQYLSGETNGRPHLHLAAEEAMILYLANDNPANKKLKTLFDQSYLSDRDLFERFINELESFFYEQPPFGHEQKDIFSLLRTPYKVYPDDVEGQLDYILQNWKDLLPAQMVLQLLQGKDLLKEDLRLEGQGGGAPPTVVPDYGKQQGGAMHLGKSGFDAVAAASEDYDEPERFTSDIHWMPRVVMVAKNAYVWLDQLSKKYNRDLRRLDQIPDEELDRLARWNLNGLWLIGIWERSSASRKVKHLMGNPDAISSAYALYDYEIAQELGGEPAYNNLNHRAAQRGIRLASDMVPNHTGIYSKWVIERPDYYIQTPAPPFPGYSFTGENLSEHPHIEIRIEDGYYNKTDAAVVFQRVDKQHNDVRYIYHGNDGTMMPWNDTAQLDMLKAEVREAVIQKIMSVARKFSIIRFDAAMTLAKKHFARLWYPRPGSGGDIPSRAEHAMTKEQFDELFPVEFWREVVDRINTEMPETLLLAEAFWFMEGYFVRTLGMHRVYNSAFMHMLKNEENKKYKELITNTLAFEPEILKRYVNFMSNPDEETAIQQFGTGDKYFGVCVLMNTLPGLPMYAHGQIEGFTEKYGMEYQRAYYNESPDQGLVERHEREIFPLVGKRYLFSDVRHFQLYDYIENHGHVNDHVFAFTNRHGDEKALVMFNNKYEMADGYIRVAAPRLPAGNRDKKLHAMHFGEAMGVDPAEHKYYIVTEHFSGLEYLLKGSDLYYKGFYQNLMGFESRVFLGFHEKEDHTGNLTQLYHELGKRGVPSVEEALKGLKLKDVHRAFEYLLNPADIQSFIESNVKESLPDQDTAITERLHRHFIAFAKEAFGDIGLRGQEEQAGQIFYDHLAAVPEAMTYLKMASEWIRPMLSGTPIQAPEELMVLGGSNTYRENTTLLIAYFAIKSVREVQKRKNLNMKEFDELWLERPLGHALQHTGRSNHDIAGDISLVKILLKTGEAVFDFREETPSRGRPKKQRSKDPLMDQKYKKLENLLQMPVASSFLGINEYEGTWYYSKEQFELLTRWLFSITYINWFRTLPGRISKNRLRSHLRRAILFQLDVTDLSVKSGYRLQKLSSSLKGIK